MERGEQERRMKKDDSCDGRRSEVREGRERREDGTANGALSLTTFVRFFSFL